MFNSLIQSKMKSFLILAVILSWLLMSGGACAWAQETVIEKVKEGAVNYAGKTLDKEQVRYRNMLAEKGIDWRDLDTNNDDELDPLELVMAGITKKKDKQGNDIPWKDWLHGMLLFACTFGYRWLRKMLGMPAGGNDHADKRPPPGTGGPDIIKPD